VKPLSTRLKQAPLAKISPNISEISDAGEGFEPQFTIKRQKINRTKNRKMLLCGRYLHKS
jgi:hypothetical protein